MISKLLASVIANKLTSDRMELQPRKGQVPQVTGTSSNLYGKVGSGKRRRRRNRHKVTQ